MTLVIQHKQTAAGSNPATDHYRSLILSQHYFFEAQHLRPDLAGMKAYNYQLTAISEKLPLQLYRAEKKLLDFAALPVDWDAYGAPPVSGLAVSRGTALLRDPDFWRLLPRYNARLAAFPRRDGGLQLDVDGGPHALEVVVSEEGDAEFTFFATDNAVAAEFSSLAEAMSWHEKNVC